MTVYLLDTDAYSQWKRGHRGVHRRLQAASRIYFSAVVAGELLSGFRRGSRFEQNMESLRSFLGRHRVEFLPVSLRTSDRYSRIAASLRARGTPIPTNDIWVAAHTFETGSELLTFDGHYERVGGLVWTRLRPEKGVGAERPFDAR